MTTAAGPPQKFKPRETTEVLVGAVIGPIARPEAFVAGLYQSGTLRMVGRTVALKSAQSSSLADVLVPAGPDHPGPESIAANRFGPGRDRVALTRVDPTVVAEISADAARRITPFGLLGDASGVRGLLAGLRGEILAVQADSVAPVNALTPATDAAKDGTSFRDRRRSRLALGHRRDEILSAAAPSGDPQSSTRSLQRTGSGGPDEQWREALHYRHVEPADADITVGAPQVVAARNSAPGLDRKREPRLHQIPPAAPLPPPPSPLSQQPHLTRDNQKQEPKGNWS